MARLVAAFLLILALALPAAAAVPMGWESLRVAPLTFHFQPKDAGIARVLAEQGPQAVARLADLTGLPAPRHIDIMLVADPETFLRLQPARPPEWAAGTAFPELREVWLRSRMPFADSQRIDQVLVHEICHVLLGAAFEPREPPRWLSEGLARVLAEEINPQAQLTLLQGALSGSMWSLHQLLDRWPSHAGRAALAYAQSQDFVAFLADQGPQVLPTAIAEMARGTSPDAALIRATGKDLWTLERDWKDRLTFWHMALPVAAGSGFGWFLLGGIFTWGAWRRRARTRKRIAAMGQGNFMLLWVRTHAPDEDLWMPWTPPSLRPATLPPWPHPPSSTPDSSPAVSPSSPEVAPGSVAPLPGSSQH